MAYVISSVNGIAARTIRAVLLEDSARTKMQWESQLRHIPGDSGVCPYCCLNEREIICFSNAIQGDV